MSDYGYAQIYIGGKLPANLVNDFIIAVNNDTDAWDKTPTEGFMEWLKDNVNGCDGNAYIGEDGSLRIVEGQARWAQLSETESFCRENNLTFIRYSESCGECNPEISWKTPEMNTCEDHNKDINDKPSIPTQWVRDALKDVEVFKIEDAPLFIENGTTNQEFLAKWSLRHAWNQMEALKALVDHICPEPPAGTGAFEII